MKFWEISDAFWEAVKPLIPETVRDPKRVYQRIAGGGRKPLDSRKVFEAIVYVLKTGTQWKALPKDIFGLRDFRSFPYRFSSPITFSCSSSDETDAMSLS